MAKFFDAFVLLSLAVCAVHAACTVHVRRALTDEEAQATITWTHGLQETAKFIENGTIEEEFNITKDQVHNTVTTELCRFVAYYHLVEAVDNGSNIHYYLKQNALEAVAYWRTTYCSECNVDLTKFGRMCLKATLDTFIDEMKSTFPAPDGVLFEKCNWLNNLLEQQELQGMCSQLAVARFKTCDYLCE